jgi:PEP-CTERM motif-containing protein
MKRGLKLILLPCLLYGIYFPLSSRAATISEAMPPVFVGNVVPGVVALCEDAVIPGGCLITGSGSDILRPTPDPIFGFHTGVSDFVIFNQNLAPGVLNFAVMCSDTQDTDPPNTANPGCGVNNVPALLAAATVFLNERDGLENNFERVLYTPGPSQPGFDPAHPGTTHELISDVPEPATLLPFTIGLIGLLGSAWRRMKQRMLLQARREASGLIV